ncbi:purine permease 1-like isoform X1 [Iris pallida]|uniref:Purine permease 1-like isoform X1 n=1 Tax=Iris pallida TaxID=29817 RepID=A0AAX6G5G8_IRIPA|nr:purine permease 1-like isoform X1 [Iris pallida]
MDVESASSLQPTKLEEEKKKRSSSLSSGVRRVLIVANCLLVLGTSGGPLISRLYSSTAATGNGSPASSRPPASPSSSSPSPLLPPPPPRPLARPVLITPHVFLACAALGVMTGLDDSSTPTASPSSRLHLRPPHLHPARLHRALRLPRRQAEVHPLLPQLRRPACVGAVILGLHASSDRPAGTSKAQYFTGFFLTLGAAALYGLVLPSWS